MTLGERLRAAMEARGLSAEAVGRALGVTGAAVRKWRLGDHEPDVRTLVAFADLTGASLLWLLEGDEAPPELADWAVAFADLVASGADPAAALSRRRVVSSFSSVAIVFVGLSFRRFFVRGRPSAGGCQASSVASLITSQLLSTW